MIEIFGISFESGHLFAICIVCLLTLAFSNFVDMTKLILVARKNRRASKKNQPKPIDTEQTPQQPKEPNTCELNIDKDSLTSSQRLALAELESIDNKIRLLNESRKHYIKKLENDSSYKIKSTK